MKIFSWVANKIGGKQEPKRSAAHYRGNVSECRNDEFSDWPQSLLAIGTFGNRQLEEEVVETSSGNVQAAQDPAKFTEEEEADSIRRELEVLLLQGNNNNGGQAEAQGSRGDERRQVAWKEHDGECSKEKQPTSGEMVTSKARAREMVAGKKRSTLKPRSVASLLRLLACKGGFATPVLEPRSPFPQSRMEKLLKAILEKKIHPQNPSTAAARRHQLDWKLDEKEIDECLDDALRDLDDDGAKWVKTDSDFIVLEM